MSKFRVKDESNVLELRFWSCVKAGKILYYMVKDKWHNLNGGDKRKNIPFNSLYETQEVWNGA
ncbi:hypothetical protein BpHYR1_016631 [Brachionus plicatilis]|uniref:Uncharacterized protein n=1 Tax=Brachionus plicatilis TaxID=10195 RepID=A0A3M7QTY1_BRAPC|nr:hypothetical protein BpHYR1_016631 [Brachionus plicatilis]